jgi:ATP-binding cassette subfamily F protein 3
MRKALANTERTIARLDEEKRSVNSRLLEATDPDEALRLHHELGELARQLAEAEDRWCKQQEELGEQ